MADAIEREVVIAIGANVPLPSGRSPRETVERVGRELAKRFGGRCSRVFTTAPVGPPQPDYANAVVVGRTSLEPLELLAALQSIERSHGRDRSLEQRWGPRTLDLDIVWLGDVAMQTDALTLPHPRYRERVFVLEPLLDVAPDACDPLTGERIEALLARLHDAR